MLGTYLIFYGMLRFPFQKVAYNKTKRRILKRVLKENKARQISRKTNISYPLIHTRLFLPPDMHTDVYASGGKKCSLFGKFDVLCFLETPVLRFALLPYYRRSVRLKKSPLFSFKISLRPCQTSISSYSEVFLRKGLLKICSKFTWEHACRSAISIKLQSNFIEIAFRHGFSTVNLLHIFRIPFPRNTYGWLLLDIYNRWLFFQLSSFIGV